MLRKIFLCMLLSLALGQATVCAQKAFKPVRAALKDKKYGDALKSIETLRKDSVWKNNALLTVYSIEAYKGLNDAENTKLYLKKNYDTLSFFSTTLQIVQQCVRLDSIERANEGNDGKRKYRRLVADNITKYFHNVHAGARFLYKRHKFAESLPYLETCLDLPSSPVAQEAHFQEKGRSANAALHLTAAFNAKQYDKVPRYVESALGDTASRASIYRCLALASEATGDTVKMRSWLEQGWKECPSTKFFFIHLADLFLKRNDYQSVLTLCHTQLMADSADVAALLAQCNAAFHLSDYALCIRSADALISVDSIGADAYYYKGASLTAQAQQVVMPDNINSSAYKKAIQQRRNLALQAEPMLERYRELAPNEQKKWAPLLYHTYLILNRGKKFAEIDNLLQGVKPQWPQQ